MLEQLVMNLVPGSKIRRETLEGREYIIVPMVMITNGVHEGSNGALYYPDEELGKGPGVWDHKPIVIVHPTINGMSVSACDPVILETRKVGLILNTKYRNEKLRAEAWLEIEKLRKVDARVLDRIEKGERIEVSTGLITENEKKDGEFKGKKYTAIARNFKPDHLAILPDGKGACSIADGGGLNVNRDFSQDQRDAMAKKGQAMKDGSFPIADKKDLQNAIRAVGRAKNPNAAKKHIIKRAKALGCSDMIPDAWEMNRNAARPEVAQALQMKLEEKFGGTKEVPWNGYIQEIYPGYVIYWHDGGLYASEYGVGVGDNDFNLAQGSQIPVKRVTSYQKDDGSIITKNEAPKMTREERVKAVITANVGWTDAEKDFLVGMPDDKFAKIELMAQKVVPVVNVVPPVVPPVVVPVTTPVPVTNAGNQPVTLEEFVRNAPPELRDALNAAVESAKREKARLIGLITANKSNTFAPAYLESRSPEELRAIALLAAAPQQVNNTTIQPNFFGAAGGQPVVNATPEEPLKLPKMF